MFYSDSCGLQSIWLRSDIHIFVLSENRYSLIYCAQGAISNCTTLCVTADVFTARSYANAVCAVLVCPSVGLPVRLSDTSRYCVKTAKHRITQTTPHDSPRTLVFWCQRSPRNSTGVTTHGGAKCRCGVLKSATFDK